MLHRHSTRSDVAGEVDRATSGPVRKKKQTEQKSVCFCSLFVLPVV
jgi:hypothetical protein